MKTTIGIDYGTLSARAVLVDTSSGAVLCNHVVEYPHGVMEGALACPKDYEDALIELLEAVTPEQYRDTVVGICVDATSLTLVPVTADGKIVGMLEPFLEEPHAQIKMWKRHEAAAQADEALELAGKMNEPYLQRTGGALSSEWMLPKLLETRDKAPEVYKAMDYALDLCDFLTMRLTGKVTRSVGTFGFKSLWFRDLGFPSEAYLNALRPGFAQEYPYLLRGEVYGPGESIGVVCPEMCRRFGLRDDVVVAAGFIDAHTPVCALGALGDGEAALTVGTSACLLVQTQSNSQVQEVCGIVQDAIAPGMFSIECAQAGAGDMLAWYMGNAAAEQVMQEAREKNISPHTLLCQRIREPWNNRVTAVDWWNGSRSVPYDLSLQGGIVGLTLETKPEELYLALLQAIVCGTRECIDRCNRDGAPITRIVATGGISMKNPLMMQQYADICNCPIYVGQVAEGPALGTAIYAAVAAGVYGSVREASEHMGVKEFKVYEPDTAHREEYEALYRRNHALRELLKQWNKA